MDEKKDVRPLDSNPANRDPITEEPGSHPVGTGVGAAGGAAAGAAVGGAVGGPVGAVVGGAVGAVAGGAAGHAAGEAVNPTVEADYWRQNYNKRPYYTTGKAYSEYEPAYRYGWESATRPEFRNRPFTEVERDLEKGWDKAKGATKQSWYEVKDATRDAYDRIRRD
jgi:phage tail tape-measure protein